MEENQKQIKNKKLRKIEQKINDLKEKNNIEPKKRLEKKIIKLEKKKEKLEKWLKIKLPFRILIRFSTVWLAIGIICLGSSYVPILKEVKTVTMAAIAYVAPEPLAKALDIVTLNVGAKNNDFEWLKTTVKSYLYEEIKLETESIENNGGAGVRYDGEKYVYTINGKEVSETEYNEYIEKENAKIEEMAKEVFGTDSSTEITSMSIAEIITRVATNSTPELVSQLLDMSNLTKSSRERLEKDINKALKIVPKLNNNQMNELVDMTINIIDEISEASQNIINQTNKEIRETEIEIFNQTFKMYEGEQSGATIKQLINQVKVSNANSEYKIVINVNEVEIEVGRKYTVTLKYGEYGRVNEIIVK